MAAVRIESRSEGETRTAGADLARRMLPDGVLLLYGEMGSGKTVLAKGVAQALGVDAAEVQSPTYTLVHEHDGTRGHLVHVDLYRLEPEQAAALGLEEILSRPGLKVIEWAERLPFPVAGGLTVRLARKVSGEHVIEVVPECAAGSATAP